MSQALIPPEQEEWLKVLGKGMITLPKPWREMLGITPGDVVKAKKEGKRIVIEVQSPTAVPYRLYSTEEINQFLHDDVLPEPLRKQVSKRLTGSRKKP